MKISYISPYDARDIHSWSGLGHYIADSLEFQGADIEYIGNLYAKPGLALKLKSMFYKRSGKDFAFEREKSFVKQYAKQANSLIKKNSDIIFSLGTLPVAFLKTTKPKVFYTDCTFAGMINFYPDFSNLSGETIKHGNNIEQAALESSAIAIYASEWAAKSATDNYNVNPDKIKVVPFGANVEHENEFEDIKYIVSKRSQKLCSILFLGVDWERKGGEFAIKVVSKLNEQGLKTILHLVGNDQIPGNDILPDYVLNHGFISKSTTEGKRRINQLIMESHFLILPTKAEAYGLSLCEANSFGTPCITTNVGGIPTIIKDNINGMAFALSAKAEDYANYIHSLFTNITMYQQLAYNSFNEYKTRLNWKVAGASIMQILHEFK